MAIPSSSSQSPSTCQSQNPTLDCSQSAPAAMQQVSAPRPLSPEKDASLSPNDHLRPLPLQSNPDLSPVSSPSSDTLRPTSISPDSSGGEPPEATEGDIKSDEAESTSILTAKEECLPEQPMDQEVSEGDTADAEMESPVASGEREQPDGDRCSSSDSIPSLAAALKELHELLVQSQSRSVSRSPSDKASPEPSTPTPENATANAAGAETSDAKANRAASDEEPSRCLTPDPPGRVYCLQEDEAESGEGLDAQISERDGEETCPSGISEPEPGVSQGAAAFPEFREPPEGQHGRGVADGQASRSDTPDAAASPPEEVSSSSSFSAPPLIPAPSPPAPLSPPPFIEQFPAEHIQRIQAAGFSAREAVEALEQAHGVVEVALLALLARSITVPT